MRPVSLQVLILLFTALVPAALTAGQNQFPAADTSASSRQVIGNIGASVDSSDGSQPRKVEVLVTPDSAAGASITIVRKSKIQTTPGSITILAIPPDTIGTWRAPLSMLLFQGDYKFIATRPGFRAAEASARLAFEPSDSISINMFSLDYLRMMRERWGEYKWISAGVTAGAGIATLYFYEKIGTDMNEYNTATAASVMASSKNAVTRDQNFYRIASAVAFTAVGSFLVTWVIQGLCHK